jgi:two-component system, chemotaxis family, chemotaxis protein CheY
MGELDADPLPALPSAARGRRGLGASTRPVVLVGEDDTDIQEAVSELLAGAGYSVVCADDGGKVAELLEGGLRPSVILLDLMMPRVNGHDFLAWRSVRPDLRRIPVIVSSASPFNELLIRSQAVAALLPKPATSKELLSAVARAVEAEVAPRARERLRGEQEA